MTRRLYVKGSLGAGGTFWDADTGRQVDLFSFRMDAHTFPQAEVCEVLRRGPTPGRQAPEMVDMVPWPGPKPGAELFEIGTPAIGPSPAGMGEEIRMAITGWRAGKDGAVDRDRSHDAWGVATVDHQLIAAATSVEGLFEANVERAYVEAAVFVAKADARKFLATPEAKAALASWQAKARRAGAPGVFPSTSKSLKQILADSFALPVPKVAPKATCEECWGTGYWRGSGGPCSKGCKP